MGGPRDHDDIDVLPQHPGRVIWAHEGLEEFQGISLDNAESLRLLEERWLREDDVGDSEGATGVSRWRPVPPPSPAARCPASMRRVELDATARLGTVGELLVATGAGLRSVVPRPRHTRGAGVSPAADPADGAQLHYAVEPDHRAPAAAAPAATPWLTTPDARPALRIEAWHHADLREEEELLTVIEGAGLPAHHHDDDHLAAVAAGDDPFGDQPPNHVTRGLQSTWEASDVEGAWA
jgi:hypothetical protein